MWLTSSERIVNMFKQTTVLPLQYNMKGCPTYQHYYEEQALKEDYEHIGLRKGQGDNGQESGGDRIEH